MKNLRINALAVLVAVLSLSLGICSLAATGGKNEQVRALTADDSGKTLVLKKGDFFTLTLRDRVDGGFHFNKGQFDPRILRLDRRYQGPPNPDSRPGRPGTATWEFSVLRKGKTILRMTVSRSGTPTDSITNFQNLVLVK